jgi:hypothetical protein
MVFFRDILNAMADGLGVKAWSHANPFLKSSGIGLVCFECVSTGEN